MLRPWSPSSICGWDTPLSRTSAPGPQPPPAPAPGQWGLSEPDKGKKFKRRELCFYHGAGGGAERGRRGVGEKLPPPQKRTGVYLFTSDTTQFDFPHKRSNNISVTVNYTPQMHIKGWPASAQPLLCRTACARISRPASPLEAWELRLSSPLRAFEAGSPGVRVPPAASCPSLGS